MAFTSDQVIDKIKKLLRLAERAGTPEEAAAAASMASRLQEEYRIESLTLEAEGAVVAEEIGQEALDSVYRNAPGWRGRLSVSIARANGCHVYYKTVPDGKRLMVVGRLSDQRVVIELFHSLAAEIDRLAARYIRESFGGRSAGTDFRQGAVDAIHRRLLNDRKRREETRPAGSTAMVLLAKNDRAVEAWAKATIHQSFEYRRSAAGRSNDARLAGYSAGSSMKLTREAKLGAGSMRQLGGGR